ncbi:MAG: ferrous iron transport protein B [Coriobacteriales bacterium]|nr:ferrous iron transport protein B [Coriobacteriales bacterium]
MANITIALAGNPNCGKTTLFNALTGSNQYVGNWPGVTVEEKHGKLRGHSDVTIADLPGIYSLSPYTLEEVVARDYLTDQRPDAIINIVDGTNLERNLYLTTQLVELGIPVLVAVNMMDVIQKSGDVIDLAALAKALDCKVVAISALKGTGVKEASEEAVALARAAVRPIPQHRFAGSVEHAIAHIEEVTVHDLPEEQQRWYAIKLFERDEKVQAKLSLSPQTLDHIENDIKACETELDDDAESIITSQRYDYITSIIGGCLRRANAGELTTSDKIDKIVTNRILAIPIFVLIMFCVYALAMGDPIGDGGISIGTYLTDWTNDVLGAEWLVEGSRSLMQSIGASSTVTGLVADGIANGVGAVLGFVPQMLVLFLMLAILEDCGYMARIAFIMDRIFRRFGLSGKSFIPMLVGTGCGVPGVMASRTIENERDRRMTITTTCFIPCGAKMPIIGLIAGALFAGSTWVATSAYFIGVAAIIISGVMLKKTKMFAGDPAPFVMELPAYHVPSVTNVLRSTWERGWSFIKKAGTIILISSVIIWGLSSFGVVNGTFGMVDDLYEDQTVVTDEYLEAVASRMGVSVDEVSPMDDSILSAFGNTFAPIFAPLGFGSWKPAVATVTGLVAKEEVVSTFAVLYNADTESDDWDDEGSPIWANVQADFEAFSGGHGQLAAFAFMIFNLLCAPCFAAMGAIKREMNNGKWTAFAIGYMCAFAYGAGLVVYQLGIAVAGAMNPVGMIAAVGILGFVGYMLFVKKYQEADRLLVE